MGTFDNLSRIDVSPAEFLATAGRIFAVFGEETQDSGNVSYGVEVGERRLFVKTAGDPSDGRWFLTHSQRVALLRNAVELYRQYGQLPMAPLRAVIESPHGPVLVHDWAEGELLRGGAAIRNDEHSAHRRFADLPAERVVDALDGLYALHAHLAAAGWVAVDFYDGCLIYDFAQHRLSVVDLDHYHRGPFVNEMGRMFGSTRFMAPEEFERGATIDQRTTVFSLGRTAAIFLGDGSMERAAFRGSDGLYAVVRQACQKDPADRYPTVSAFHQAWLEAR